MEVSEGKLAGLLTVKLDVFKDHRGFFVERFNRKKFQELGLPTGFCQYNHSRSSAGVLRGLHFQDTPAQGKFVGVSRGCIWDVVVDIRHSSETYGQYESLEISDSNATLLWVPPGFAHGFCVLGEQDADVIYHVTEFFNPQSESGIQWDDPELAIDWPVKNPIISESDSNLPSFSKYQSNPKF